METLIKGFFLHNWQRKSLALLTALIVWFFVSQSINETKTVPSVPIRITNLPPDKTILGMLPNGILNKRISLTLTGSEDVISQIEPGDLEVQFDASTIDRDDWVMQITKKNLISLNPAIDLTHHISGVSHTEFIVKFSRLVTSKIPLKILPPKGQAPKGYEFLDIWPQQLMQTVSGPEEAVHALKIKGLELTFDLNDISKADLDILSNKTTKHPAEEISFSIPNQWKEISISFQHNLKEDLNDPDAQNLHIDFLRKEFIPIGKPLPVRLFYPLVTRQTLNPSTLTIQPNKNIQEAFSLYQFMPPLFAYEVSRLFLDIVRDNLELVIIAAANTDERALEWGLEIIDTQRLENRFVETLIPFYIDSKSGRISPEREKMLRRRFQTYTNKLVLYRSPIEKFQLDSRVAGKNVVIEEASVAS